MLLLPWICRKLWGLLLLLLLKLGGTLEATTSHCLLLLWRRLA